MTSRDPSPPSALGALRLVDRWATSIRITHEFSRLDRALFWLAVLGIPARLSGLTGPRSVTAADVPALVDAMVRLSQLAAHHREHLAEADLNPVVVLPFGQGILALDAVLVCRPADAPAEG